MTDGFPSDLRERVKVAFRRERLKAGLSRRQMADLLGVEPGTVAAWEQVGPRSPNCLTVIRTADLLRSPSLAQELFAGTALRVVLATA